MFSNKIELSEFSKLLKISGIAVVKRHMDYPLVLYVKYCYRYTSKDPGLTSLRFHYPKGSGQLFSKPTRHRIKPDQFGEVEVSKLDKPIIVLNKI